MRRLLVVAVVAFLVGGFCWWRAQVGTESAGAAPVASPAVEAPGTKDGRKAEGFPPSSFVPDTSGAGGRLFHDPVVVGPCNLVPLAEQDVSSQTDGFFQEVLADLGQRVTAGQLLGRLDDRRLRPQVELLEIRARSRAAELIAQALHDEADGKVKYAVEANQSGLKAVSDLEHRAYLAQRERYRQEIQKAREDREAAVKELEKAQALLALHEIRSALSGEVVAVYRRSGEAVKPAEPLFRVANFDRLRVEGLCKASQAPLLRVGLPAAVEPERRGTQLTQLGGHTGAVRTLACSPDGRLLASGSADRTASLWLWPQRQRLTVLPHAAEVQALTFAPTTTGYRLLTGTSDGSVTLWMVDAHGRVAEPVRFPRAHDSAVRALTVSPDGRRCASAGEDRQIAVWDLTTGTRLFWLHQPGEGRPSAHQGAVTAVHFTPDGSLISAGRDNALIRWELGEGGGRLVSRQPGRSGDVDQLGVSPDGQVALFEHGAELRLLRTRDWSCVGAVPNRQQGHFQALALFAPGGRLLLTGTSDGRLQVWRAPVPPAESSFFRHGYALGADRSDLAALGRVLAPPFPGPLGPVLQLAAPKASGPRLWDLDAAEVLHFLTPAGSVLCGAFAPNGSVAFTGGTDSTIRVWALPPASQWTQPLEATITFIGGQVERGTDLVRVRAELANPTDPARRLRPGTHATLRVYPEMATQE